MPVVATVCAVASAALFGLVCVSETVFVVIKVPSLANIVREEFANIRNHK